jgi:hypothetical protein
MNFRLIWVGPEDDGDGNPTVRDSASATADDRKLPAARYTIREGGMVRCEQLGKGRARFTPVANFTARIVRDLIIDDEAEPRREFSVEADLEGQRLSFPVPAADFGRMAWVLNRLGPRGDRLPRAAAACASCHPVVVRRSPAGTDRDAHGMAQARIRLGVSAGRRRTGRPGGH